MMIEEERHYFILFFFTVPFRGLTATADAAIWFKTQQTVCVSTIDHQGRNSNVVESSATQSGLRDPIA